MQSSPSLSTLSNTQKWLGLGVAVVLFYIYFLFGHERLTGIWADAIPENKPPLRELIGLRQVERQLDRNTPTGKGVKMGHVEGNSGDYLPNLQDNRFRGVSMVPMSGTGKINGHAQATARTIYGRQGLAPGVNDVHLYTSDHFLRQGVLKVGTHLPPDPDGRQIFTHSWIGFRTPQSPDTLRRVDYLIDTFDVIMTVGVNNGARSAVPPLLGSAHNVIAVGVTSGHSSGGYTTIEGKGRCKPDIVAPKKLTSFSTPVVAAMAARLLESAGKSPNPESARHSEVIEAVLMAGAEKPEDWTPQPDKPLDEHLGAGTVRFDSSYQILNAGPIPTGRTAGDHGWDFQDLSVDQQETYWIDCLEQTGEVSIMLVWNRRIDGRQVTDLISRKPRWLDLPREADFDLRLLHMDDDGRVVVVSESTSRVDNVEHIYTKQLPPGRYSIEVTRKDKHQEDWDYAIAWRVENRPDDIHPAHAPGSTPGSAPKSSLKSSPGSGLGLGLKP